MKKILIILLVFMFTLSIGTASVAGASDTAVFRLQTLGIIDEYDESHIVTRAEAASGFVKLLVEDAFYNGNTPFSDVSESHKYAGEINYATGIGIVNGVSTDIFNPDVFVTGMQLVKMAVVTLGYKSVAESEGGYEEGYKSVAVKQRLMTGFPLYDNITMSDFVILLNKMLDMYQLEPVYGTDRYEITKETIYEKILRRNEMANIKEGILTAAGISVLNGHDELLEDEVSIDGTKFKYFGKNAYEFLGKSVTAYYKDDEFTGKTVIINILPKNNNNKELTIKNRDIKTLTATECVYDVTDVRTNTLKISPNAAFIYNRINYTPISTNINLSTGDIRLLDSNYDGIYDVVFIDEYESFVVERLSVINTAVYFKKNILFRGKSSFKFDFKDEDKKYYIYDDDNNQIQFEDIKMGSVITFISSMDEKINFVTVSKKSVIGTITEISENHKGEKELSVDGKVYSVYKPNESEIFINYGIGNEVTFYLNNKNEIVDGEVSIDGLYGYVIGISNQKNLNDNEKIQIIQSGFSKKEIEISGDTETIKYNYQNSEAIALELASKVKYMGRLKSGSYVTEASVNSSDIDLNYLKGSIVKYKLNGEGKANLLESSPIDVPALTVAPKYNFNGKLNSFGGLSTSSAFLIGNSTNVICIPNEANPDEDDYYVEVTVADKAAETVVAVNIDEKTQIADCVVVMRKMNASELKPFASTTKYSIVGKVTQALDMNNTDEKIYKLEVLTDEEFNIPYVKEHSHLAPIVAGLKCGDIIRYNTKSTGEVTNIQKIAGVYEYGSAYGENMDGTVFGLVSNIELNRLDDYLNTMIDIVTFANLGGAPKAFKLFREEGPQVYSYGKQSGKISIAETDEIMMGSELFLFVQDNIVKAVVIFK